MDVKKFLKRAYVFLFKEESLKSYIAFFIFAYLVLKFILFPTFLFVVGWKDVTSILSPSMVHGPNVNVTYYTWWMERGYNASNFTFSHGLDVGDAIIVVDGNISIGDVIVFYPHGSSYTFVHRVVDIHCDNTTCYYTTKGDANMYSLPQEINISRDRVVGKVVMSIPYLGWPRTLMFYILGI